MSRLKPRPTKIAEFPHKDISPGCGRNAPDVPFPAIFSLHNLALPLSFRKHGFELGGNLVLLLRGDVPIDGPVETFHEIHFGFPAEELLGEGIVRDAIEGAR